MVMSRIISRAFSVATSPLSVAEQHVKTALSSHIAFTEQQLDNGDWKKIDFSNPALKFKVVRDCMSASGLKISNVDLTNIFDTSSLVACLAGKLKLEQEFGTANVSTYNDPIRYMFLTKQHNFPENVYFAGPDYLVSRSKKKLLEEKQKLGASLL